MPRLDNYHNGQCKDRSREENWLEGNSVDNSIMFPFSDSLLHHSQTGFRRCVDGKSGELDEMVKWSITADSRSLKALMRQNDRWLQWSDPEMISSRKITFFFFYLHHLTWMKMTHCFPLSELSTSGAISNMWTQWVVHWESDSKPDRLSLINWGASEPLSSTEGAETLKLSHRPSLPRQPMPRLKWITRVR